MIKFNLGTYQNLKIMGIINWVPLYISGKNLLSLPYNFVYGSRGVRVSVVVFGDMYTYTYFLPVLWLLH
ncbi:hypothetical protein BDD12DRAFT_814931 [Trichophaea hybrida]|nr:hypothetical protein BDD12DRAFT_814931 [Trichophaea hybrida]